jgi:hypothetical protein
MRLVLFACAESAAIDQATNRLSVFHFLEDLSSPTFPTALPSVTAVFILAREEAEADSFNLTLRVTESGRDQPILEGPIFVQFQGRLRSRLLANIAGLPLVAPGRLQFAVFDDQHELARWEVTINQLVQPQITQQPSIPDPPSGQTA